MTYRVATPSMTEVLNAFNELDKKTMIEALRSVRHTEHFKMLFDYAFNPNIKWDLPEGEVPYQPWSGVDAQGALYGKLRTMYIFLEGQAPNMQKIGKETKFIQLLESIDKNDALMICYMKDNRKLPQTKITKKIVEEAFPDLKEHWKNGQKS